jgi:hypothetical protein
MVKKVKVQGPYGEEEVLPEHLRGYASSVIDALENVVPLDVEEAEVLRDIIQSEYLDKFLTPEHYRRVYAEKTERSI